MPTLNAFDNGDVRTTIIVFHPHYHDGARVQGDTMNTLTSRMGTGGNNVSMVAVIPIHDKATRFAGKRQMHDGTYLMDGAGNGLGIGKEGDPMNTLTGGDRHAIATFPIQGTTIGRSDTAGPQGKGFGDEHDPMYTLDSVSGHGVATVKAYDEYNDSIADTHHTLRSGTKQSTGVVMESNVRRLTPVECERLQGFPDDWTAGQSDSHRYKQMGNAVAVPVVEWLIQNIVDVANVS